MLRHEMIIGALLLGVDAASKQYAVHYWSHPFEVASWLSLGVHYNTGAAFGALAGASGWQTILFLIVGLVTLIFSTYTLRITPFLNARLRWSLWMLMMGTVGNMIDRIWFGHVIDFINLQVYNWYLPSFNVADVLICCGCIGLFMRRES